MVYHYTNLIRDGQCVLNGCSLTYIRSSIQHPLHGAKAWLHVSVPGRERTEVPTSVWVDLDSVQGTPIPEIFSQVIPQPRPRARPDDETSNGGSIPDVRRSAFSRCLPSGHRDARRSVLSGDSQLQEAPGEHGPVLQNPRGATIFDLADKDLNEAIRKDHEAMARPFDALSLAVIEVNPFASETVSASPTLTLGTVPETGPQRQETDYNSYDEDTDYCQVETHDGRPETPRRKLRDRTPHLQGSGHPHHPGFIRGNGNAPGSLRTGRKAQSDLAKAHGHRRHQSEPVAKPSATLAVPTVGMKGLGVPESPRQMPRSTEAFHLSEDASQGLGDEPFLHGKEALQHLDLEEVTPTRGGPATPQASGESSSTVCRMLRVAPASEGQQGCAVPSENGEAGESIPQETPTAAPALQERPVKPTTQDGSILTATQDGHAFAEASVGGGCGTNSGLSHVSHLHEEGPWPWRCPHCHGPITNAVRMDHGSQEEQHQPPGVPSILGPEDYDPDADLVFPSGVAIINLRPNEGTINGAKMRSTVAPADQIATLVQLTPTYGSGVKREVTLPMYGKVTKPLSVSHPHRFKDHGIIRCTDRLVELGPDQFEDFYMWRESYRTQFTELLQDSPNGQPFDGSLRSFLMNELRMRFLTLRCNRHIHDLRENPDLLPLDLEEPGAGPAPAPPVLAPTPPLTRRVIRGPTGTPLGSVIDHTEGQPSSSGILTIQEEPTPPPVASSILNDWESDAGNQREPPLRLYPSRFTWFRKRGTKAHKARKHNKRNEARRTLAARLNAELDREEQRRRDEGLI